MSAEIHKFHEAALAYCTWAECRAMPADEDAVEALRHLTTLYRLALDLPDVFGDEEPSDVLEIDAERVEQRFSNFPFKSYVVCYNPLELNEKPALGDISDDLSDIWSDLQGGLTLYKAGHYPAAAWNWRFHFMHHWGRHAAFAISAIHIWLSNKRDGVH